LSGLRLRPATAADLAYVTGLERSPEHVEGIGQWTDAQHLAAIRGEDRRSHSIIERDGERAGYLIAYDRRAEVGGYYVKRLLVAAKDRGTGSSALALFGANAFARPDCALLWLHVRTTNARAQAVYRKLGYVPFEEDAERFDRAGEALAPLALRMILRRGAG
jgi:ribosomal protein S18 acetylase RimI-like enzyme